MATIEKFEDIAGWQKARELTRAIYQCSKVGEFGRDYGLRDQIRRASTSIMSNIAEGFGRDGTKELLQFLSMAKGSCGEVRSQLYVALDQGYLTASDFKRLGSFTAETSKLIAGFMRYLRNCEVRGNKY